jgi:hypothetical protein
VEVAPGPLRNASVGLQNEKDNILFPNIFYKSITVLVIKHKKIDKHKSIHTKREFDDSGKQIILG